MELSAKQRGVVRGAIPAALISLLTLAGLSPFVPADLLPLDDPGARLAWAIKWALVPTLALMISIMRVANYRFASPADIDGSSLTLGTAPLLVLRANLQNTLEQSALAVSAYCIWSITVAQGWLGVVPVAALLFGAGRVLFALGYERGAAGRATGFGLTAYPTFAMLIILTAVLLFRMFAAALG